MKKIILFLFLNFIFSCNSHKRAVDIEYEKIDESMISNPNRYDFDNKIYKVNRVFKYKSIITETNTIINEYDLEFKILGTTLPFSNYDANYNQTVFEMIYNDTLGNYLTSEKTGLVENNKNVWFHPPRNNNLDFGKLQLNAFPFVLFPLKKNKWTWVLDAGYGEFKNTLISHDYINQGKEVYVFNNEKLECWRITCNSHSKEGVLTSSIFLFNEKLGFVKMIFNTFDNQQYILELIEYKL